MPCAGAPSSWIRPAASCPLRFRPCANSADLIEATKALLEATLRGDISPREARDIGQLVELHLSAIAADRVESQIHLIQQARR